MGKRTSKKKSNKKTKNEDEKKPVLKASRKVILKSIHPPVVENPSEKK